METTLKSRPMLYSFAGNGPELDKLRWENPQDGFRSRAIVRLVRGKRMPSWESLFSELSAALQFPLYFGMNANALYECLGDLDWIPGESYTLLISDSLSVLRNENEGDLVSFLALLADVSREWSVGTLPGANWERKPTPFRVVLQHDAGGAAEMKRIVSKAAPDATLEPLRISGEQ